MMNLRVKQFEQLPLPILILIFLIAFTVLNVLCSLILLRIDLSKNQAYTLSNPTKKIVKNIRSPVTIRFYVSSDLPTRMYPVKTEVTDILHEYKRQNGNIQVEIVDPKKDVQFADQAQQMGIPELQFSELDQNKYAVSTAFFGIALLNGNTYQIIPQVTNMGTLEYNISAALYKLTQKSIAKIGLIGAEELSPSEGDQYSTIKQLLGQQFDVDELSISTGSAALNPVYKTILFFDDNQSSYTNSEIVLLKQYLDKKGKIIFFLDGVWVSNDLSHATEAEHNLFPLLKDYGITLHNNLVLSTSSELVNFSNDVVQFVSQYPYWVKTENIKNNDEHSANINVLVFPWVSSLSIQKKMGYTIDTLVSTSQQSWEEVGQFNLTPQSIKQPEKKRLTSFILVASSAQKNKGEIIVIPSSRFIKGQFPTQHNSNAEFVLNMVNNFASDGALTGIRDRLVDLYPLPELTGHQKDIFKYLSMLLLPILFALYGIVRIMKRP